MTDLVLKLCPTCFGFRGLMAPPKARATFHLLDPRVCSASELLLVGGDVELEVVKSGLLLRVGLCLVECDYWAVLR